MKESIYACLFSTGLIKVGRSIDPVARMASHADRLSCAGICVLSTHSAECVGDASVAEALLINRCASLASRKHKSEWFDGLSFGDVVLWVAEFSALIPSEDHPHFPVEPNEFFKLACEIVGGNARMAETLKVEPPTITQWVNGDRPIPAKRCPAIEKASLGKVACEQLCPDVDWGYLRGTKKAA